MSVKQKLYNRGLSINVSFFLLFALILSGLFASLQHSQVSAIGNCPGAQVQGVAGTTRPDVNACYNPGATTPTADKPAGTTPVTGDQTPVDGTAASSDDEGVTCAVEKVGWMLCPIIESAAKISDKAFGILADNFLRTDPELFSDKSGTKTAWEIARNLANVMFIIAFIIIILSQVTGRGLDNYGIKKMLPRLIIAAIAVNVSYYICQLVVDVTNILGYEIQNALAEISNDLGPSVFGSVSEYAGTEQSTGTGDTLLYVIAAAALGTAAVIWVTLPMLASVVLFVLITVITIIIILLLRKAIIVLLIVVSPIAFVLYLLPNTEKFFSKWMSMFGKLLMVFPIVGILFGAGQLASTIVLVSGAQSDAQAKAAAGCIPENKESKKSYENGSINNYDTCGAKSVNICGTKDGEDVGNCKTASWTLGLVAMGIAVAPLMAVWAVLKGALSAAGALGGKIATNIQNGVNRGGKGIGAGVQKAFEGSDIGRGRAERMKAKDATKQERFYKRQGSNRLSQIAAGGLSPLTRRIPGNTAAEQADRLKRAGDMGMNLVNKRNAEDVQNALTQIEYDDDGKVEGGAKYLAEGFGSGDGVKAKAAIAALTTGGELGYEKLYDGLKEAEKNAKTDIQKKFVSDMKEFMLQAHPSVKEKNAAIGEWMKDKAGTMTLEQRSADSATYSKLTDKQFATQTQKSLQSGGAAAALAAKTATADGGQESRAYRLLNNPETAIELNDIKRGLMSGASVRIEPSAPPATPNDPGQGTLF